MSEQSGVALLHNSQANISKTEPDPETLIEEIAAYIESRLGTNRDFLVNLACILVAAAAGARYYIMTEKGKLRLNLSVIIIGGSGISEKSVSLNIVRSILKKLEKTIEAEILLPPQFTKEALTKKLSEDSKKRGVPEGVILSDEYTTMIKNSSKEYMAGALEFSAQLYDGYVENALTIKRGHEKVDEVYINFVGLTTFYVFTLLPEGFWTQGNGARIIFNVEDEREYSPPTDEEINRFWNYDQARSERELDEIAEKLAKLYSLEEETKVTFNSKAQKIITSYREECRRTAHEIFNEDVFDTRANSLSRLPEFALKKSALHAVARCPLNGEVVVNYADALFGVNEARKAYEAFLKIRRIQDQQIHYAKPNRSDVTRKMILGAFTKDEMTSSEIEELTGVGLSSVQRHLRDLAVDGLVSKSGSTKSAKWSLSENYIKLITSESKKNEVNILD